MRKKNVISGIGFLVAAVFVIIGSTGVLGDIEVWKLLLSFLLVMQFVKSLFKLQWGPMLFCPAILAILYDEALGIENLTPWPVLGAALLGSIGFSMIFGRTHKYTDENGEKHWNFEGGEGVKMIDQEESDYRFVCDVTFGSFSKYIKCQKLQEVVVDNSFGQTSIYFDEAVLDGGRADVTVDNSFGCTKLFIPSDWDVKFKVVDEFCGKLKNFKNDGIMNYVNEDSNKLFISIDTSFGDVEVHYI
ncbi:MAG: hypothetical protein IKK33_18145 [Lachnospiraceae bacterium]|nr:hypothetical protein [Lachnospiraceae bacterium]